jgi:hypothetical protein
MSYKGKYVKGMNQCRLKFKWLQELSSNWPKAAVKIQQRIETNADSATATYGIFGHIWLPSLH